MLSKKHLVLSIFFAYFLAGSLSAMTYTVSKDGSGMFTTIRVAINSAQAGDTVKILDAATYQEQVTIDSTKNGLTLMSSLPTALNKPKIVWQDIINVGPKTYSESLIDSMITFDRNGALRLLGVRNVTINGISIDGGGPYVYGYPHVWGNMTDLVRGNAAVILRVSGGAHITNCDIFNAYYGIYVIDENQGGIFANANPAALQPQNIVPMSGFGKTGNHLIEYCRIHNNSFGMFFESIWDLGSTIRYNLIYENHHQTTAFAKQVYAMPPGSAIEGHNQPGGAILFYDVAYSPLAIYNNTFWHNFLIFIGAWRPGYQHLIFNNIYAKPFHYWSTDSVFANDAYMDISPEFANRLNNCIYSCQNQASQQYYVVIMNGFPSLSTINNPLPALGTLISTAIANAPFPATSNIRWIEMDSTMFQSMDPAMANFLTPNWNDTLVAKYIKNQGWQNSGVKNMDGSWADIGAVSSDGGRPTDLASIRPADPVSITGTSATIKFTIDQRIGQFQNPKVKLCRFDGNLPVVSQWAGSALAIHTVANINDIFLPPTPALNAGVNTYTVTIPVPQTADYAFFEMIIEGTGFDGKFYTTSTGFLPYRNLNYKFVVQIWNSALTKQLDSITVGDTVILKVIPQSSDGTIFTNTITPVQADLSSGFTLWTTTVNPVAPLTYPQGITGSTSKPVMFTKVPSGGIEIVSVSGIMGTNAFLGSAAIHILAGPASAVVFQDIVLKGKRQIDISCFDLQGRRIFHRVLESYSGSMQVKDFQHLWKNKISTGTFIVRMTIKDGGSTLHKCSTVFLRPPRS